MSSVTCDKITLWLQACHVVRLDEGCRSAGQWRVAYGGNIKPRKVHGMATSATQCSVVKKSKSHVMNGRAKLPGAME